jgi:hypothetical protein
LKRERKLLCPIAVGQEKQRKGANSKKGCRWLLKPRKRKTNKKQHRKQSVVEPTEGRTINSHGKDREE